MNMDSLIIGSLGMMAFLSLLMLIFRICFDDELSKNIFYAVYIPFMICYAFCALFGFVNYLMGL